VSSTKPQRVGPFPFPKSDPNKRVKDFSEVQQPYNLEQAIEEAKRCLLCGTPVCIDACPVQAVSRNDLKTAFHRIRETNAMLGVTARCCPQLQGLCEGACVMQWSGQPISIGMIQRVVSDWERDQSKQPEPEKNPDSGRRVSIIGSGPSGIAAAALLRRYGHLVKVYDELKVPGGTAWYGIPDYHLPKEVLEYEIERVKGEGVEINTGVKVGKDIALNDLLSETDAVLIATGAKDIVKLNTPGIDLDGVLEGYDFLEDVYVNGVDSYLKNPKYDLAKDILVIGGGDSALDCARTARRLSQGNVTIIYRRTEKEMPADPLMVDEAKEEGVQFKFLVNPKTYNPDKSGGKKLASTTMDTMQLGEPDQTGRRSPKPIPGKEFEMKCSAVIMAVGRGPNSFLQKVAGLKMGKKNSILVDDHFRTSINGVFAAGDVTTGETLVVKAMGSGRNAAQRVHEYLMGIDDSEHVSLYEQYYVQRSYEALMAGKEEEKGYLPPP
jgi:glutamate synthase (NADPH/NADH) small chain